MASGSGFDEALSHFLAGAQGGNLVELLRQKCAIGSAITDSFNSSDVDALTFAQSLSYRKIAHMHKDDVDIRDLRRVDRLSADLYCIFHQQLCMDWQSKESPLDRSLPIFEILPHRNTLIHLTDPKTNCLVLLTFCFGLDNVLFVGLHNVPESDSLPGPYLGLLHPGSRESFLRALSKMETLYQSKLSQNPPKSPVDPSLECNGRLAELSYLSSEFDDLFGYVLCDPECYSNFTEPLLLRMYSNRLYGKMMLPLFMRGYRKRNSELFPIEFLKRFNALLRIVCRMLNHLYSRRSGRVSHESRNFGTMAVITLIYSYLYGLLSVPIRLTPWNKTEQNDVCTCRSYSNEADTGLGYSASEGDANGPADADPPAEAMQEGVEDDRAIPSNADIGLIGVDFASTAADAACVESTRRRDVMMCHAIGLLSDDGNWIRRAERYVDVIDNYKLSLCWYRRPLFSSSFATNFRVLYPWAIMYHQTNVASCASAWLQWQGRTIESWSSLPLWRNTPPRDTPSASSGGDCVRCLKRLVCLRMRDCVSFLFDLELDIKRAARKHHGV